MKIFRSLLIGILSFFTLPSLAQLTLGTVDVGPYTPGSSIAATFKIDDANCIKIGNVFTLRLSDVDGNFTPGRDIGTYNSFYSTFVNGTIPPGTLAGSGYRFRIESSNPAYISNASDPFEIRAGDPVQAIITSDYPLSNTQEAFGFCSARTGLNANIRLTNDSKSIATVTFKNELDGRTTSDVITTEIDFAPNKAHYTMFVKVAMPNGTIATKAYFIINNETVTAFSTRGPNIVCLPGGALNYYVDTSKETGIINNFPGNTYRIRWGDGSVDELTYCDLKSGTISHTYTKSSCGQISLSGDERNVFGINVQMLSPFCGNVGTPLSTTAKVVTITENKFRGPVLGCTSPEMEFINNSILGQDPESNRSDCAPDDARFNWFVDDILIERNRPFSYRFRHFFTPGVHKVRLESISSTGCPSAPFEQEICIQPVPIPKFTLPVATSCTTASITPENTSTVDLSCASTITYLWTVTPAIGVVNPNVSSNTTTAPTFRFTQPGKYTIGLRITTPNCGTTEQFTQNVIINSIREVDLSPSVTLCTPGTFNFSTAESVTKTTYSGTEEVLDDVYSWTVTAANGGTFSFIGASNIKYPSIKFDSFDTYTITATVTNICGTTNASQILTFTPSPIPLITATKPTICHTDNAMLNATITNGAYNSFQWVGNGYFSVGKIITSNPANLNTVYTPTAEEREVGKATVSLLVNTGLTGECAQVKQEFIITILPNNTQTNATQTICTGTPLAFTPTSSVAGSTFTWTAENTDGNAAGFSLSGTGSITDLITNNHPTADAVVIYTIIPSSNGCEGVPFTYTVTITPRPIITAVAAASTICSNQSSAITITPNLTNTKYTWTVAAPIGVTGYQNNTVATVNNIINVNLVNNANLPLTVTYTITPISDNNCSGMPITVSLTVQPLPTTPNAGLDESICTAKTYVLKGNKADVGTGKWEQVTNIPNITFSDDTDENATVIGLQDGNNYIFRWTITSATGCSLSDEVEITVNPASVGGITSGTNLVCAGTNTGTITLVDQIGTVVRWESSLDGTNWTDINNTTTTLTFTNINAATQFRAVVQSGACPIDYSSITAVNVNIGAVPATVGSNQVLCAATETILSGNDPLTNTGVWTLTSGQTGVNIVDPTKYNTQVIGLQPGKVYKFLWTISGLAPCGATSAELIVSNLAEIKNNEITTPIINTCTGQVIRFTGSIPTGGDNTYTYVWEQSIDGNTWTVINGQTNKDLNVTVNASLAYRRKVKSGTCDAVSNAITITALPAVANNSILTDQTICAGQTPNLITGSAPTGGDGINYTYSWEQSTDGNTWVFIPGAADKDYQPTTLTQTTSYRRLVASGACAGNLQSISKLVKITVNPNAKAEFTFVNNIGCIPFVINATNVKAIPNTANDVYTWYADGTIIGTGINFPGYTINETNKTVAIKLMVTSRFGCEQDEYIQNFSTRQSIVASFTQDKTTDCGPLSVTFTNTTSNLTDVSFKWDFGNGITSNLASPTPVTFLADPLGEDKEYTITLSATTPCGTSVHTSTVLVKPMPKSVFSPSKTIGCSPLKVTFTNTSPGKNNTFVYDFGDGTTLTTTDKKPVSHTYITTTVEDFIVKMTATNDCGTSESQYTINVSPNTITAEMVVNSNQLRGCAPLTVDFFNNSIGANFYRYTFGDGSVVTSNATAAEKQTHTFTKPGTYVVELFATNGCSEATTTETITVLAQPNVAFKADYTTGCVGLSVKFTNNTTDAVSYLWDFGDGKTSTEVAPTHVYNGAVNNYTVKLTAINSLGCSQTTTLTDYIKIVPPPIAAFAISPAAVISIPNYTFQFKNESTNAAQTYQWSFGDGVNSTQKDPLHTYLDTGKYLVTMRTFSEYGCADSVQKYVQIVGVPGYLYLPNSFIPGGTSSPLQTFMAIGSGIQSWKMTVFNKWGQVLWETTQLNDGKPVEGWDGTHKNVPQPQGIYFWKMEVKLINGTEWKGISLDNKPPKRTGEIYLIR